MADAQSATAAVGSEADCSGDEPIFCETDDELLEGGMMEEAPSLSASMPHAHQTAGNADGAGGAIAASDSNTGKRRRGKQVKRDAAVRAGQPGWSFVRYQKGHLPKHDSFYVLGPNGKETCYLEEKLRGPRCKPGDRLLFCRLIGQKQGFFIRDEGGGGSSRADRAGGVPGGEGGVGGARSSTNTSPHARTWRSDLTNNRDRWKKKHFHFKLAVMVYGQMAGKSSKN